MLFPKKKYKWRDRKLRDILSVKQDQSEHFEQFFDLVTKMLQYDPSQRISPQQALNHPFIAFGPASRRTPTSSPSTPGMSATWSGASQRHSLSYSQPPPTQRPSHSQIGADMQSLSSSSGGSISSSFGGSGGSSVARNLFSSFSSCPPVVNKSSGTSSASDNDNLPTSSTSTYPFCSFMFNGNPHPFQHLLQQEQIRFNATVQQPDQINFSSSIDPSFVPARENQSFCTNMSSLSVHCAATAKYLFEPSSFESDQQQSSLPQQHQDSQPAHQFSLFSTSSLLGSGGIVSQPTTHTNINTSHNNTAWNFSNT